MADMDNSGSLFHFHLLKCCIYLMANIMKKPGWVLGLLLFFFFFPTPLSHSLPYLTVSVRRRAIKRRLCKLISQGLSAQELFVTTAKGMKHI